MVDVVACGVRHRAGDVSTPERVRTSAMLATLSAPTTTTAPKEIDFGAIVRRAHFAFRDDEVPGAWTGGDKSYTSRVDADGTVSVTVVDGAKRSGTAHFAASKVARGRNDLTGRANVTRDEERPSLQERRERLRPCVRRGHLDRRLRRRIHLRFERIVRRREHRACGVEWMQLRRGRRAIASCLEWPRDVGSADGGATAEKEKHLTR
jgi:hypothetical protein